MSAVLPVDLLAVDQPDIRFIDPARRLQGWIRSVPRHITERQPAQFLVDEWDQLLQRRRISLAPCEKQLRYGMRCSWRHPGRPVCEKIFLKRPDSFRRPFSSSQSARLLFMAIT